LLGCPKTMNFRDLQGSLSSKKLFMTVFEFIGQFFFQNDVFKLQGVFSELEIRVFLEKFPDIAYFTDFRPTRGA
jgi:hypothetical protein